MIVQCPQCGTKYRLPKEKVPEAGVKAKCKGCGNVIRVSRPAPEKEAVKTQTPAPSLKETWQCVCGTANPPASEFCIKCKRSKKLFTKIAAVAERPHRQERRPSTIEAPSASFNIWRSLLLVGALAVILGIGISYALGYAVNQSISTFLTTIFK